MDTSKQMKSDADVAYNLIELDKETIRAEIKTNGSYKEEGIEIKNWEGDKKSEYYLGTLKTGNSSYLGILNTLLKRHNYGVNQYENGDIYFGNFDMDMKDGHGAYFYTPSVVNNCMHSEIYYGHWRENQKDKIGIYIWLREMQGLDREENKLEGVDFDAFVGEIENDCYSRGCYLTKLGESFYVYYGGFDQEGHKNDDNGLFYDNVRDSIFKGKIVNDKFVSGYLISFDDYGELKNMIYVEIDDNDLPIKLLKPEEIEENIKSTVLEQAKSFKSALVDFDYFTDIYEKVIEIRKFVNTKLDNLAIFDSNQDYPKMFKMSSEYNLNNMYREVKKKEKYFLD